MISFHLDRISHTHAEEEAAEDEHEQVVGRGVDSCTENEGHPSPEHGPLPPKEIRHQGRNEGGEERRHIQRRSEDGQELAIEHAVDPGAPILLLLLIHRREERQQERIHRCHPSCRSENQEK